MRRGAPSETLRCEALLLGRVAFGEADLIVHLFTDVQGKISALARGARRSKTRFVGALEPMHTLLIEVGDKPRGELHTLKDTQISRPRTGLTRHLDALSTAGRALSWVRKAAPAHTPEPQLWRAVSLLLDELSTEGGQESPESYLASFGVRLLAVLGWGLNLVSCVSCGKPCPPGKSAWIHPERGGLICRQCGGGPIVLTGEVRAQVLAAQDHDQVMISAASTPDILRLVERALGAHMGLSETPRGDLGR